MLERRIEWNSWKKQGEMGLTCGGSEVTAEVQLIHEDWGTAGKSITTNATMYDHDVHDYMNR